MKGIKKILKIFFIFLLLLLVWGVVVEPRLIDTKTFSTDKISNLPSAWKGKKIAFIADMQIGMWIDNQGTSKRIVEKILDEKPDLILIGGDFIYHPVEDESLAEAREEFDAEEKKEVDDTIARAVDIVRPLASSGIPTFAVLGNHDYGMELPSVLKLTMVAKALKDQLQSAGITVLHNEHQKIFTKSSPKEDPLYLIGIGPNYPEEDNVEAALAGVPSDAPRVIFMHNPQSFRKIPADEAPFAVAGHTHGGQIRIPFTESWTWMEMLRPYKIGADGWIKEFGQEGNHLYVNRGIGFSRYPIRMNCLPEITYFTLK